MQIEVKKLYRGNITLRSHMVERAIRERQPIEVYYKNQKMTLPPAVLERAGKHGSKMFVSQFNMGEMYHLVDYRWTPEVPDQEELFN